MSDVRTEFSTKAFDLAATFKAKMAKVAVGPADYRADLTTPDGPSTGGGVQAVQHIRLVPKTEGFPTLVVGSTNQKKGLAEIKTFDHVDAIHQQRFKQGVNLDREGYDQFVEAAKSYLESLSLKVTLTASPPPAAASQPAAAGPAPFPTVAVVSIAAVVIAIAGAVFMLRR